MKGNLTNMYDEIIKGLFETNAIRVAPEDKPFWYTSGKIGLLYVNTHFLYGSEEKAVNLLNIIDENTTGQGRGTPERLHDKLIREIMNNYRENKIYNNLINNILSYIKENIEIEDIGYISGGERRDWLFSLPVAEILNKEHITIYKNMECVKYNKGIIGPVENLGGAKVLHIADLITVASSYEKAWIPAIKAINGSITQSVVVVDRDQGGSQLLEKYGVSSHSLCRINFELFVKAIELGYINKEQSAIIKEYLEEPDNTMRKFIKNNPDFLNNAANGHDEKTAQRAKLCIEKGFYS